MTSKILELGPCQPEPTELPGGNYPQINGNRFLQSLYHVILPDGSTIKRDWLTYSKSKTRSIVFIEYYSQDVVKKNQINHGSKMVSEIGLLAHKVL